MSSGPSRESGWGAHEKALRYRQAEQARQVVKPDANDAFTFKRPKPQQHAQQQPQTPAAQQQPQSSPVSQTAPASSPNQQQQQQASATPVAAQTPSSVTATDEMEQKYPSSSPTGGSATSSSSSGKTAAGSPAAASSANPGTHQVLCSVLVELFEMVTGAGNAAAPKAYGPKGVILQRLSANASGGENNFQLLVFAPVTKKVEFAVDINASFAFSVLPDRFASFDDVVNARSWCLKFGTSEDAFNVARCYALITETRMSGAYAKGASRGILRQDLTVGGNDGPSVQIGDQIKCKYAVYAYDPATQPFYIGRILFSLRESAKYIVGAGSMLPGVEESLIGMRKKSTRLLIIPPAIANAINQNAEWGPHVRNDTTLIVEVTVSNVRSSVPVNAEDGGGAAEQQQHQDQHNQQQQDFDQANQHSPQPNEQEQQQQQQHLPYHLQPSSGSSASAPYPSSATGSSSAAAPIDESAPGVYNPPSASAAQMDLKSRMALLANASHTNGLAQPAAAGGVTPSSAAAGVATRRESLTPREGSTGQHSQQHQQQQQVDELEQFLSDLSLSEILPNFRREGVGFTELLALDADELKQLVPLLGPRKRILAKLSEVRENRAAGVAQQQHQHPQRLSITTSSSGGGGSTPNAGSAAAASPALFSPFGLTPTPAAGMPPSHPASYVSPQRGSATATAAQAAAAAAEKPAAKPAGRSRFLSDAETDVVPSPSYSAASTKHLSQLHSQAQLDALLASEYERGKTDTVGLAKAKIQEIKDVASGKFAAMQEQLEQMQRQNEADREKAREMVQRLREDVRSLTQERDSVSKSLSVVTSEKDSLTEKTQKYVAQMKEKLSTERETVRSSIEAEMRGAGSEKIRDSMEQLFGLLQAKIKNKDLYEGDELLSMVKSAVKSAMKAQQ